MKRASISQKNGNEIEDLAVPQESQQVKQEARRQQETSTTRGRRRNHELVDLQERVLQSQRAERRFLLQEMLLLRVPFFRREQRSEPLVGLRVRETKRRRVLRLVVPCRVCVS